MPSGRFVGVACLLLLWLLPVSSLSAAAYTVNSTTDAPDAGPGDGICATASGLCTLRAAVQEANASPGPDTITVPPGLYALTVAGRGENLAATGDLDITQPLTISGAGPGVTIIDGNAQDRVFHVIGPVNVQISGLTVRNGSVPRPADISADGGGGAIYSSGGARLALTNVTASGNTATSGAALNDDGGALTVTNSTFFGNTTSFGGGIFNNGTVTIANSTFAGNAASSSGGAIYNRTGSLTLTGSTVSSNTSASASVGGGGILNAAGASLSVTGSLIASNSAAANGGGIHSRGQLSLANSTLSGNSARDSGGALFVGGGSGLANNITVAMNSADGRGGGIETAGASFMLRNSLLANNQRGGNCGGATLSQGYNLDSSNTCGFAGQGDVVGVDPLLGPLGNNGGTTQMHGLFVGSLAVDAGSPAAPGSSGNACEATDQRGTARPTDGNGDGVARCDIGAYEAPASPALVLVPAPVAATPVRVQTPTVAPTPTLDTRAPTTVPPQIGAPPRPVPPSPPRGAAPPTPVPPPQTEGADPDWLLVPEGTQVYSVDGDDLGVTEVADWYRVVLEEGGWLLVVADPAWPVWIEPVDATSNPA